MTSDCRAGNGKAQHDSGQRALGIELVVAWGRQAPSQPDGVQQNLPCLSIIASLHTRYSTCTQEHCSMVCQAQYSRTLFSICGTKATMLWSTPSTVCLQQGAKPLTVLTASQAWQGNFSLTADHSVSFRALPHGRGPSRTLKCPPAYQKRSQRRAATAAPSTLIGTLPSGGKLQEQTRRERQLSLTFPQ